MKRLPIVLLLIVLGAVGCGPGVYQKGRQLVEQEQYDQAIDLYYQQIKNNPNSSDAWRELGYAYFKQGQIEKAEDALAQATLMRPDARTEVYRGMVFESENRYDDAISAYTAALALKPGDDIRKLVNARLLLLTRARVKERAKEVVAQESTLDAANIPENAVAVVDFDGSSLPDNLKPIAKGLAELVSSDLASISELTVLERMQIDAILAELKLNSDGYTNSEAAPRAGKLLGSRQVITGNLLAIDNQELRVDGAIIEVLVDSMTLTDAEEGQLGKFFDLEKRLVNAIIDSLGIQLTTDEQVQLDRVPTRSLPAFLAWSRGLELERQGMYSDANQQFQQAINMDPNFGLAAQHAQMTAGLANNQALAPVGAFDRAVLAATSSEGSGGGGSSRMLQQMSASNNFIPNPGPTQPPILPPQPTPQGDGTGTVVIEGNLDGN